jgi:uncharacterized protein (DUF983 family)
MDVKRDWIAGQPPRAGIATMLWRGVRCRCPRCGEGGVLASWFRLKPRCPTCGYRFQREEGFWLGAYVINFAVTEGLIGVVLFAYIFLAANNPDFDPLPVYVAGLAAALIAPVLFFPPSRTIWSAIDLSMRPIEPAEVAEAILYADDADDADNRGGPTPRA